MPAANTTETAIAARPGTIPLPSSFPMLDNSLSKTLKEYNRQDQ